MAINLYPRAAIQPVQSQTGGIRAGVEPMRDATGQQLQALGQSIQGLGEVTTKVADVMQDDVDMATSARMTNLFSEEVRKALEDPDEGYLSKVGMAAGPEARKAAFERIGKAQRTIAAMGQNKVQQLNFQIQSARLLSSAALMADRHQEHQAKVYRAGEMKQLSETTIGEAIRLAGTDEGEAAKIAALRHVDDVANTYGWPEDSAQRKGLKVETLTKIHSGVIDTMLAGSRSDMARDYLSKVPESEMDPQQMARAQGAVRTATVADESTRAAFSYMAQAEKRGGTTAEQMQYAMSIADYSFKGGKISAETRDAVLSRLGAEFRRKADGEAQQVNSAMSAAAKWLTENPMASLTEFASSEPQTFAAISEAGEMPALQSYAANRRFVTDPKAFAEMMDLPAAYFASRTPGQIVREWRGRLDDQDLRLLLSQQTRVNGQKLEKNEGIALTRRDRIVESFYKATKKRRDQKLDDAGEAELYQWRAEAQKRIDAETKEVDDARLQEIMDEMAVDRVSVERSWRVDAERATSLLSEEEKRAAYVTTATGEQVYVRDVPDEERKAAQRRLKAWGRPVTEAAIVDLWIAGGRRK